MEIQRLRWENEVLQKLLDAANKCVVKMAAGEFEEVSRPRIYVICVSVEIEGTRKNGWDTTVPWTVHIPSENRTNIRWIHNYS